MVECNWTTCTHSVEVLYLSLLVLLVFVPDDEPGHPERLQLLSTNHQPHEDQQPVCKKHRNVSSVRLSWKICPDASHCFFFSSGRHRKWSQQRAGQSDVSVLRQRHADAEDAKWCYVKVRLRCESMFLCWYVDWTWRHTHTQLFKVHSWNNTGVMNISACRRHCFCRGLFLLCCHKPPAGGALAPHEMFSVQRRLIKFNQSFKGGTCWSSQWVSELFK